MYVLTPIDFGYSFWTGVISSVIMIFAIILVHIKKHPDFNKGQPQSGRTERASYYYQLA